MLANLGREQVLKIYLDDTRETPAGWVRCYWPTEVIALLSANEVEALSLDHDLGDDARGTGYDVLTWIEEQVVLHGFVPPRFIAIHSDNGPGVKRMRAALESIARYASIKTFA